MDFEWEDLRRFFDFGDPNYGAHPDHRRMLEQINSPHVIQTAPYIPPPKRTVMGSLFGPSTPPEPPLPATTFGDRLMATDSPDSPRVEDRYSPRYQANQMVSTNSWQARMSPQQLAAYAIDGFNEASKFGARPIYRNPARDRINRQLVPGMRSQNDYRKPWE